MRKILAKELMDQRETVITILPTIPDLATLFLWYDEDKDDACDWLTFQCQLCHSRSLSLSFIFRDVRIHPSSLPLGGLHERELRSEKRLDH